VNRPRSGAPRGNESRPGQGGHRDITDATSVTDAADDTLPPIERVRQRWAAYQLDLKPVADGVWVGPCPSTSPRQPSKSWRAFGSLTP
jgi:hypothetical protein